MVHNESVNVWTHLIGLILIFILFFYTAIFISNHNFFIEEIQGKFKGIKTELESYATPIWDKVPSIENLT